MPRYKLIIEYDGTPYAGWQKQADRPTVQSALAQAVLKFSGAETDIIGAGRTDAGVHALAQAAHVDLPKEYDPFSVMQGLNFYLYNSVSHGVAAQDTVLHAAHGHRISVISAELVADDFHARFSATRRHYLYRIINRRARLGLEANRAWHAAEELDARAMRAAARLLVGHHDFTSFRDTQCQARSPEKTLDTLDVKRAGEEIHITASARSFLHHQVRIMVGTLAMVGKGKWSPNDVKNALAAKNRAAAGPTAPPDGLYLTRVDY
ncbi:MAG: tRNA pseudouridine(38-40) synthase TruA [Pseudomonadota bacterium]|nr:tRNA pseudouridine(38-40) synthase TruA [Pseudomonadota bacterium]MDE3038829.1 tRNA pseudouridine(38-40) synthase TruA [Pseudomonadota bacterium]